MSDEKFVFTPDNLIENLEKLGPWSCYGLASEALQHYFPEAYDNEERNPTVYEEIELMKKIDCEYWEDVIKKYHAEVGWTGEFNPGWVNEH